MNTQYVALQRGGPLKAIQAPVPKAGTNDVVIRLRAAAINPADVKMIDQGQRGTQYPLISGFDGAGIVESIGSAVTRFAAGDEVLATFSPGGSERGGSFQTHAAVEETKVASKPTSWSFEEAASTGLVFAFPALSLLVLTS